MSLSRCKVLPQQGISRSLVLNELERFHWLVQYHEKQIFSYWIPSHVGIRGNEVAEASAEVPLFSVILRNTSMSL